MAECIRSSSGEDKSASEGRHDTYSIQSPFLSLLPTRGGNRDKSRGKDHNSGATHDMYPWKAGIMGRRSLDFEFAIQ